jgi:NitT/TauT family transport system permease protein
MKSQYLWEAIFISLLRLIGGYFISVLLGGFLGLLCAHFKKIEETLGSLLLGLQTLPSVCWLPLALLWFGLNNTAMIFVIVMGSVLSIAMATISAIKGVSPLLIQAGRTMGATGFKLYWHVILPAGWPTILHGMKQAWSFAWRSLMAAELLFVNKGLGNLLNMGRDLNDMSQVFAIMILIVLLGSFTDLLLFKRIEGRLIKVRGLEISI